MRQVVVPRPLILLLASLTAAEEATPRRETPMQVRADQGELVMVVVMAAPELAIRVQVVAAQAGILAQVAQERVL